MEATSAAAAADDDEAERALGGGAGARNWSGKSENLLDG